MKNNFKNPLIRLFARTVSETISSSQTQASKISRRKFIQDTTLATVVAGVSPTLFQACSTKPTSSVPTIAIIGGGIAGLSAAHSFHVKEIPYTLFEGSDRLGGRIHTLKDVFGPGLTTELGAEFIDTGHVDMINLVKEYGLELYDIEKDVLDSKLVKDLYFFKNRHISEKELVNEFKLFSNSIAEDIAKIEKDDSALKLLDEISLSDYLKSKGITGWLLDALCNAFTSEMGIESSLQSSLNLLYMLNPDTSDGFKIFGDSDERYKIIGGNSLLIQKMGERLKESLKYNHKLTRLDRVDNKFHLYFNESNDFVKFDYVILAIPFTVLRKITLNIDLPEEKSRAIQELGYGTNSKIILGYEERVWRRNKYSGYLFGEHVQNGWDSTIGQANNQGEGSYTVFLGGEAGKNAKADQISWLTQNLNEAFVDCSKYRNDKSYVYNWSGIPLALGSYSAYTVGQYTRIAGHESTPVGNLFFAGEHCSEDFQGYMNGGAETGRRAAEEILFLWSEQNIRSA